MKSWSEIGFSLEKTQDGSPTLRRHQPTRNDFQTGESMHHSGGAWEETLYIYKPVIEKIKEWNIPNPAFLSVGLGLGYVELMIAKEFLGSSDLYISSYEIVPELKDLFLKWLAGKELPEEVQETYDLVGRFVSPQIEPLKMFLLKAYQNKNWILGEAFESSKPPLKHHGIMYDAFSKAVSPQLWEPEFLLSTFSDWAAETCCLSTYSCTGNLKRALKASGFEVNLRQGFKGKRDSTFAYRR